VNQIVDSPIRNVLATRERRAMQMGLSRVGNWIGRALRRAVRARPDEVSWNVAEGPFFANHMCLLEYSERNARMVLERAHSDGDGRATLTVVAESQL
jgi:hypothetical protein